MLLVLDKKNGEFSPQYLELMGTLADGRYLVTVRELGENKTERSFQDNYFALVDHVRDHTGDSRYDIHERFKKERKVESTTGFTIEEWVAFNEAFKWWAFKNLDLIL